MTPFNALPALDRVPPGGHAVLIFPDRQSLRACLEQYNRGQYKHLRTQSLIRQELISHRATGSILYLRTLHQMTVSGRNRTVDGGAWAALAPGVHDTTLLRAHLQSADLPLLHPLPLGHGDDDGEGLI